MGTTKATLALESAAAGTAFKASARGTGIGEARLGLSIFADVYEATHKVLITERCDGVLGLLPGCIFHNATALHPKTSQPPSFSRSRPTIIHYL